MHDFWISKKLSSYFLGCVFWGDFWGAYFIRVLKGGFWWCFVCVKNMLCFEGQKFVLFVCLFGSENHIIKREPWPLSYLGLYFFAVWWCCVRWQNKQKRKTAAASRSFRGVELQPDKNCWSLIPSQRKLAEGVFQCSKIFVGLSEKGGRGRYGGRRQRASWLSLRRRSGGRPILLRLPPACLVAAEGLRRLWREKGLRTPPCKKYLFFLGAWGGISIVIS